MLEDVIERGIRVEAIEASGLEERRENRPGVSASFAAGEEADFTSLGHAAHRTLAPDVSCPQPDMVSVALCKDLEKRILFPEHLESTDDLLMLDSL